uniref:Uncharacterized protein n=1 Tax=Peronospora matthiolae TaxID=2874970 RepID=A0AAV1TN64_9STRA
MKRCKGKKIRTARALAGDDATSAAAERLARHCEWHVFSQVDAQAVFSRMALQGCDSAERDRLFRPVSGVRPNRLKAGSPCLACVAANSVKPHASVFLPPLFSELFALSSTR